MTTPTPEAAPLALAAAQALAVIDDLPLDHAAEMIRKHQDASHSGDCTKEPHTCIRCRVDHAFEVARLTIVAYLRARADQVAAMPPHGNRSWFVEQIRHDAAELEPAPAETASDLSAAIASAKKVDPRLALTKRKEPAERIGELEE